MTTTLRNVTTVIAHCPACGRTTTSVWTGDAWLCLGGCQGVQQSRTTESGSVTH